MDTITSDVLPRQSSEKEVATAVMVQEHSLNYAMQPVYANSSTSTMYTYNAQSMVMCMVLLNQRKQKNGYMLTPQVTIMAAGSMFVTVVLMVAVAVNTQLYHSQVKPEEGNIIMDEKQTRVFKQTRLRNLKRKYARLIQHADLKDTAISIKHEIELLENELP